MKRAPSRTPPALPEHLQQVRGLQLNELKDGCVVQTPGRHSVHQLNATAAFVLELCNGQNTVEKIVDLVREAYALRRRPAADVERILAQMMAEGLVAPAKKPSKGRPARKAPARRGRASSKD